MKHEIIPFGLHGSANRFTSFAMILSYLSLQQSARHNVHQFLCMKQLLIFLDTNMEKICIGRCRSRIRFL